MFSLAPIIPSFPPIPKIGRLIIKSESRTCLEISNSLFLTNSDSAKSAGSILYFSQTFKSPDFAAEAPIGISLKLCAAILIFSLFAPFLVFFVC